MSCLNVLETGDIAMLIEVIGAAYLVLGGIWILFRVKVFGAFTASKSTAKVGSLGGEELAWYGNVLAFLSEEG
jgi:hypothetical protein